MSTRIILQIVALFVALVSTQIPPALAQPDSGGAEVRNSLVYAGQLEFHGQPVTQLVDIRLVPYDAATGGNALAFPIEHTQILPMDGWFEVLLDLPATVLANNRPIWLQIAVRSSEKSEPYVVLEPRQRLKVAADRSLPMGMQINTTDLNGKTTDPDSNLSRGTKKPSRANVSPVSSQGDSYMVSQDGIARMGQHVSPPDEAVQQPELEFDDWNGDGYDPQGCGWYVVSGGLKTLCNVGVGTAPNSLSQLSVVAREEERAISVWNARQTGITSGIVSSTSSTKGRGILGIAWARTGHNYGILGRSKSNVGYGVAGYADSTNGVNYAVLGQTSSPNGYGGYFIGARNYFSGKLGIGTTNPTHKLTVGGAIRCISGGYVFPDGTVQTTAAGSGIWGTNGRNIYYNGGNVGIGTSNPLAQLHTTGAVRFAGIGSTTSQNRVLTVDSNGIVRWRTLSPWGGGGGGGDNDSGYITAVNGADGLSGGGTSGDVTIALDVTGYTDPRYWNTNEALGGDLSGMLNNAVASASKLRGVPVGTTNPTNGQVLKYDGTAGTWVPGTDNTGSSWWTPAGNGIYTMLQVGIGTIHPNKTLVVIDDGSGICFDMKTSNNDVIIQESSIDQECFEVQGESVFRGRISCNNGIKAPNLTAGGGTPVVVSTLGKFYKQSSSRRYKSKIANLSSSDDLVLALRPVSFEWNSTGEQDIGLIAEEVAKVLPDLVFYDTNGRPDGVKYDRLGIYLIEVVKLQHEQLLAQEQRLDHMEQMLAELKAEMRRLP